MTCSCILTEIGLATQSSGEITVCNQSRTVFKLGDKPLRLDQHTLEQGWASQTRQEIRDSLNNGIRHANCQDCWDQEDAGASSVRIQANEKFKDVAIYQEQPRVFMLKPGNACNLACRHCNPYNSTRWYKDDHKLNSTVSFIDYIKKYNPIRDSYDKDSNIWVTLNQWNQHIVHYDLYGAEPLLIDPLLNLLRSGNTEQSIHVNTNGTIWQDDFNDVFGKFKHVTLGISIDAIEEQFEYMRYPAKWDHVLDNLLKYKKLTELFPSINLSVCITVSALNVYYLPEYIQFFYNLNIVVGINFVHRPDHLNMRILPKSVKQKVIDRLHSAAAKDVDRGKIAIDRVINFLSLDYEQSDSLFDQLQTVTNGYDNIRQENYAEIFKEFYEVLNE